MTINTSIIKALFIPAGNLHKKQQLKTTIFSLVLISILIFSVIMLLSFQIFYIL